MTSSVSIQLKAIETAFLFQLMGITEGETLLEDFSVTEAENESVEEHYTNVMKQLKDTGLLALDGNNITLESKVLDYLKACKYSSVSARLKVQGTEGETSVTYAFISGAQVVEMRWSSETGDVILTSLEEGVEELLSRMGDHMLLPDTEESSYRIRLQPSTLKQLQEQLGDADPTVYQAVLRGDALVEAQAATALLESCRSIQQWGSYETVIRGTEIRSQTVQFIGSPSGHWLFTQEEEGLVHGFQITEPELIQSLYLVTISTLSILAPG